MFAESYREEARKLAALPEASRRRGYAWTHDADDCAVLVAQSSTGASGLRGRTRGPRRQLPRRPAVADRRSSTPASTPLETMPRARRPTRRRSRSGAFADELGDAARRWDHDSGRHPSCRTSTRPPRWPRASPRSRPATRRAHRRPRRQRPARRRRPGPGCATGTGRSSAPPGSTSLFLLIGPRGDGLDVDAVLAARRCRATSTRRGHRHRARAGAGYFLSRRTSRCHPTSPYLRDPRWLRGRARWLARRRWLVRAAPAGRGSTATLRIWAARRGPLLALSRRVSG